MFAQKDFSSNQIHKFINTTKLIYKDPEMSSLNLRVCKSGIFISNILANTVYKYRIQ